MLKIILMLYFFLKISHQGLRTVLNIYNVQNVLHSIAELLFIHRLEYISLFVRLYFLQFYFLFFISKLRSQNQPFHFSVAPPARPASLNKSYGVNRVLFLVTPIFSLKTRSTSTPHFFFFDTIY